MIIRTASCRRLPLLAVIAAALPHIALRAADAPRERISLNADWRFQKGDPPQTDSANLLYDIRPDPRARPQERPAEFSEAAAKLAAATHPVLKQSILPTGNRFLKDPAHWYVRPDTNPGDNVSCAQREFDDSSWRRVNLPHDWAIEGPFNSGGVGGGMGRLPSPGIAWYRKKLDIPVNDAGKSVFLEVDGAMSYAAVWLNGKLVGGWPYGYASWQLNLTPYLNPGGENLLAIRLDNPPDSSRWYPGGGIYRNVWLTKTQPIHVGQWGVSVTTTRVSSASAAVNLEVTIDNDSHDDANVEVASAVYLLDAESHPTGRSVATVKPAPFSIAAGSSATRKASAVILKPRLWGPAPQQKPNRYVVVTTLSRNGKLLDRCETRFGVRAILFKPDGLYINNERVSLKGVNNHHDLGALGAAFNLRAAERQLEILREMGCNAIRTSHNPPAPELLELTDRMGFLVMDEIFDSWYRQKTPLDFHLIFPDWHEQDLRAFIRRDRNHPSVFLWSVGNEVGEQFTKEEGAAVAKQLVDIAHEENATRPAVASMNFSKPDSAFAAAVDEIALNYQGEGIREDPAFADTMGIRTPPQYPGFHEKFPAKMIFSSETASAFSSRGVYLFPVLHGISGPVRGGSGGDAKIHQVSAYELYAADFGSSADKVFAALDRHPYVAGEFVWSGWDYLGEPTPYYSSRSSYCGIVDLAGFRKDRFYLYQSRWRPELPMAHILPHWTWPGRIGQVTPVHVFTSGDEVELFLNGKSLGRKKKAQYESRLRWDDVIYQPGELKAVAYKDGKSWAEDTVATAGPPASLALAADRSEIHNDGLDLSFITVRVLDGRGTVAPIANDHIKFTIDGPGEIVATDNGDPTSFDPFQSPERNAFNGLAMVIVRGKPGLSGTINLSAESGSLRRAVINLRTVSKASRT